MQRLEYKFTGGISAEWFADISTAPIDKPVIVLDDRGNLDIGTFTMLCGDPDFTATIGCCNGVLEQWAKIAGVKYD